MNSIYSIRSATLRARLVSLLLFGGLLLTEGKASALPQFSLLTGTRCSACHFDPQGSGIRNELGWSMMNEVGAFKWPGSGNDTSGELPTNTMFGGKLIPGFDGRLQEVTLSTTGKRMLIPMQLTTSLALMPSHELSVYADVNWATIIEKQTGGSLYPGQSEFDAAIQYEPNIALPSLRVGMIEPSFGIRYDDHTVFVNRDISQRSIYVVPPDYNDVGAEVTYEGLRMLTINAGIFNAYNLSKISPSIGDITSRFDFSHPTLSARVVLWPQLLDQGLNFELGGSVLQNGTLKMYDGFAGFGIADKASISIEGMHSQDANNRILRNFTVMGSLHLVQWLTADWRYDWGQTEDYPGKSLIYAQAFTFGFEFFVLPYVEIRPEYRIYQSSPFYGQGYYSAHYSGQLHIFY